ncbi:membrane magnesium transporter-domain-containing protein [Aspergillus egyptiacus]|nr:membrane magnesium transporter-domain-containing protein [Aspergillus egyptiacus]
MGFVSRLITVFGLVLLAHAYGNPLGISFPCIPSHFPGPLLTIGTREYSGYSAHEHTVLYSNVHLSSASTALPKDIVIEALTSLAIVSMGLVLGAEKLKPVSWSEWAKEVERDPARNPYHRLEERYSFWDVRAKRKEFADWMKDAPVKS